MTSWLMWDSTTPAVIPDHAQIVAPYWNGDYAWPESISSKFPAKAWIDVLATSPDNCPVLQVDGLTPANVQYMINRARNWVQTRKNLGKASTIYVNRDNLEAVQRELDGLDWSLWLATLDGTVCVDSPSNLVAVQGWGATATGLHADLSVVLSQDWYQAHGGTLA